MRRAISVVLKVIKNKSSQDMKISIITVCYNSASTIRHTIESVFNQTYQDIEYIVVDGNSTDETVPIIKEYESRFCGRMQWISEPDNGLYDAMNKGIKLAAGDIIGILNSDDKYTSNDILSIVNKTITENHVDSCYGNILYIKNGRPFRYWKSGSHRSFKFGWMPPHPSFFVRKEIYEKYGVFRLDCGVNADYELMLRFLDIYKISTIWIDRNFVYMNAGGKSNSSLKVRFDAIGNDRIAWEVNNITPYFFTLFLKRVIKIPQFFKARFYQI
jgi:glycosyltransferase involved in cell wall biosynthesis